jgi:SAM-dependent MidA family methyltransferase
MTDEPEARRDTQLADKLKDRIREAGPLTVAAYMQACLQDPEYGYYVKQPAIGCEGDFITAPEISQVFGELIGLWCAVVWHQMGAPSRLNLVELGPGRGTLMSDALRAADKVPGFADALHVHLVEVSKPLRETQDRMLAGSAVPVSFHADAVQLLSRRDPLSDAPVILIGNEFLDTFGVDQFLFSGGVWRAREIGLDRQDDLAFVANASSAGQPGSVPSTTIPREGDVFEEAVASSAFAAATISALSDKQPFAALFIDYGHERSGFGDTLQAVAEHRSVSPFFAPGETDVTIQVDFAQFAAACRTSGGERVAVDGPISQGEFLGRLGIVERASRLMSANPAKAAAIELGVARLISPQGMGSRFKAIGLRSAALPRLPGFD